VIELALVGALLVAALTFVMAVGIVVGLVRLVLLPFRLLLGLLFLPLLLLKFLIGLLFLPFAIAAAVVGALVAPFVGLAFVTVPFIPLLLVGLLVWAVIKLASPVVAGT